MKIRGASWAALAVLAGLVLPLTSAQAQALRDPTLPPSQAEVGAAGQAPDAAPGYAVIVQGGQPHLVVGTRLVRVGQKVGNARLERITETEIWFREGGQLRKEARFAGITRTVARTPVACAATTAAPCKGAQP